jgi:hypothetical protein
MTWLTTRRRKMKRTPGYDLDPRLTRHCCGVPFVLAGRVVGPTDRIMSRSGAGMAPMPLQHVFADRRVRTGQLEQLAGGRHRCLRRQRLGLGGGHRARRHRRAGFAPGTHFGRTTQHGIRRLHLCRHVTDFGDAATILAGSFRATVGLLDHLIHAHPDARITVACGPVAEGVFARMPNRDCTIVVDKLPFRLHWLPLWDSAVTTLWDLMVDIRGSTIAWMGRHAGVP